jgi:hypothetical protein
VQRACACECRTECRADQHARRQEIDSIADGECAVRDSMCVGVVMHCVSQPATSPPPAGASSKRRGSAGDSARDAAAIAVAAVAKRRSAGEADGLAPIGGDTASHRAKEGGAAPAHVKTSSSKHSHAHAHTPTPTAPTPTVNSTYGIAPLERASDAYDCPPPEAVPPIVPPSRRTAPVVDDVYHRPPPPAGTPPGARQHAQPLVSDKPTATAAAAVIQKGPAVPAAVHDSKAKPAPPPYDALPAYPALAPPRVAAAVAAPASTGSALSSAR